jgi:molybdenum cofactor cytidylyltransferase
MEATMFNVPAIAFSQVCQNGQRIKWSTATQHAPAIIDRLIAAYRQAGRPIVVPVYAGTRGNPVLFDRSLFPELLRIEGDRGARELVDGMPEAVTPVAFPFAPPPDVDTPAAYEAAVRGSAP